MTTIESSSCKLLFLNDGKQLIPLEELKTVEYYAMIHYIFEFADTQAFEYYYKNHLFNGKFENCFQMLYPNPSLIPLFTNADTQDIPQFIQTIFSTLKNDFVLSSIAISILSFGCLNYVMDMVRVLKQNQNIIVTLKDGTILTPSNVVKMFYMQPFTQIYMLKFNQHLNQYQKFIISKQYNPFNMNSFLHI
ncbi:hypothetical protein CYY_003305 [Polysphondylium violaceum]|uniref:Transmembrane protein n=1 Tax=Polysphondylium violaceum TaxID=133409 RepID=A0A8J4PX72_9MYCE|nr:hypothetical protein CYY_003305 [Polysphondylium violaceum]